jgi:septal ring factor EnvC (AmiA/AmiB activator)
MRLFFSQIPQKIASQLLVLGILFLFPYSLYADEEQVASKKAELEVLKQRISVLQEGLRDSQSRLNKEDSVLRDVDLRINDINLSLRDLEKQKSDVLRRMDELGKSRQQTSIQLEREQRVLGEQMRAAYISGNEEYIKLLLNLQDPATVSRILSYYRYISRDRVQTISQINAYLEEMARNEANFLERRHELESVIKKQKQRWQSLDLAYREQMTAVKRLRSQVGEESEAISRLQSDEQALLKLLKELQTVLEELLEDERSKDSFRDHRGKLSLPVNARISASFGSRRNIGNLRWQGILLRGKPGSEVSAVYNGRVVYADWMRGFGLLLIIDHGDGYMSLYGHNESVLVEEGDWVESRQAVATMGMSGGGALPGLYFEIRHKGKPQDPMRWCRR